MATFVAALFTSSAGIAGASGLAAGGVGIASASALAAGGGSGLFASLTAGQIFSGVSGAFDILGGLSGLAAGKQEAELLKLQAERDEIQGLQEINEINRGLIEARAENTASTAASGLTLVGSPQRISEELSRSAGRNISIARGNASTQAATKRLQAGIARTKGQGALVRGLGRASTSILKLAKT